MRQAAEILLRARRERTPVAALPEDLAPHDLDEAYALQSIVAEALGPVQGWKVGAPSPEAMPLFSAMPAWGGFTPSGAHVSEHFRRLRGVEGEIAFLIGSDLPPRSTPYTREEVIAAIASAHPAIELLESAFEDPDKTPRFSTIGDLQSNGGFIYGAALEGWQSVDLTRESVSVVIDGVVRFGGTASNSAGTDLLRLVTYLANEGSYRTGGLRAGDWVTTGSWSGKELALPGSRVDVEFSTFGTVTLHF
ncbi:2-keto-4-pentenoate hydratase [Silvibacterium dinghuense]|uniref:2-keto-4-pentenoate hydratase n=1 Tax=Silvibacterium dinghuense TaxID=1560006 RepID=UPI001E6173CC|nr:fumarylacetoacetate hydrolase family protein [Silvibacterium dinghuense]